MRFATRLAVVSTAVGALLLSACGSDSLGTEPGGGAPTESASAVTKNDALAAKLPEKIAQSGTIVIGVDASYAPNEFLAADGKTVEGMDVDLFDAVAAKFGVETDWQPADFTAIITGVQASKYSVGVSSFTINDERKQQVNMVSYFSAGTSWATATGNPKGVDVENPCGKTIAVQTGTVQQEEDLPARQAKCGDNAMKILPFDGQDRATQAVVNGQADAMLADSPVVAYAITQSGGKLEQVGGIYDSAPYGYVVPKDQTEFAQALADALTELKADGTYDAVLEKWNLSDGAISDFAVNP